MAPRFRNKGSLNPFACATLGRDRYSKSSSVSVITKMLNWPVGEGQKGERVIRDEEERDIEGVEKIVINVEEGADSSRENVN